VWATDFGITWGYAVIQDDFCLDTIWALHGKCEKIQGHMESNRNPLPEKLVINFLSGANVLPGLVFPDFVASGHLGGGHGAARQWTGVVLPQGFQPHKYYHYDNCYGIPFTPLKLCSEYFEGTNIVTSKYINGDYRNSRPTFVGIMFMDYPGDELVRQIINLNRKGFLPGSVDPAPYGGSFNHTSNVENPGVGTISGDENDFLTNTPLDELVEMLAEVNENGGIGRASTEDLVRYVNHTESWNQLAALYPHFAAKQNSTVSGIVCDVVDWIGDIIDIIG